MATAVEDRGRKYKCSWDYFSKGLKIFQNRNTSWYFQRVSPFATFKPTLVSPTPAHSGNVHVLLSCSRSSLQSSRLIPSAASSFSGLGLRQRSLWTLGTQILNQCVDQSLWWAIPCNSNWLKAKHRTGVKRRQEWVIVPLLSREGLEAQWDGLGNHLQPPQLFSNTFNITHLSKPSRLSQLPDWFPSATNCQILLLKTEKCVLQPQTKQPLRWI